MHLPALRCLVAATILLAAVPASASGDGGASCELPAPAGNMLADRAGLLARYERLPQSCLRTLFSACSEASNAALLDMDSAAVCSLGYEALLQQGFQGSFPALMAWWRSQKEAAPRRGDPLL
jgi:hypothetical protein